jgi:rare lipoprotein A
MNEHRPREIQLTSKQLVFVFMSTVLVAVIVFLLGVWVGRGIDTGSMAATDAAVGGSASRPGPATPPASGGAATGTTEPKPLTYPESLTGGASGSAPAGSQPAAPASPSDPPSTPPQTQTEKAAPTGEKTPPAAEKAEGKAAPPAPKPPTSDGNEWGIQVGAFSARAGANKVASDFKAKGYPVTITAGPTFRVWLGPYSAKTAQEIAARLRKEGQDLSVIPIKPR